MTAWTYRQLARGEYEILDPSGRVHSRVTLTVAEPRPSFAMQALTRTLARIHGGAVQFGGRVSDVDPLDVLILELDAGQEHTTRTTEGAAA